MSWMMTSLYLRRSSRKRMCPSYLIMGREESRKQTLTWDVQWQNRPLLPVWVSVSNQYGWVANSTSLGMRRQLLDSNMYIWTDWQWTLDLSFPRLCTIIFERMSLYSVATGSSKWDSRESEDTRIRADSANPIRTSVETFCDASFSDRSAFQIRNLLICFHAFHGYPLYSSQRSESRWNTALADTLLRSNSGYW